MTNPTQKPPERAYALQKYLRLHSQHDALQKHLTQITTSVPTTSPSRSSDRYRFSPLSSSPASDSGSIFSSPPTPIRQHHRTGSMPHQRPQMRTRRSSIPAVIDESILGEIEEDELKLKDINQQIKSTMTDLLNCESVKDDRRYRTWVMTRLMDAEKELKINRSRSSERRRNGDISGMIV